MLKTKLNKYYRLTKKTNNNKNHENTSKNKIALKTFY